MNVFIILLDDIFPLQQCFARLGAELPKCYLLVGPIGINKMIFAGAIAREVGVPFFACNGRALETHFRDGG
jgi:ATP-dependent Zn protease